MARYGMEKGKAPQFSAGRTTSEKIQVGNLVRSLVVRVRGNLKVLTAAGGNIRPDAPYRLVRGVRVVADGETFQEWNGVALERLSSMLENEVLPQVHPSDLAAGKSTPFDYLVRVPFYELGSLTSDEKSFPTYATQDPILFIEWGQADDLVSGKSAGSVLSIENADVEVYEETLLGVDRSASRYFMPIVRTQEQDILSTKDAVLELDNVHSGWEVSRILVETLSGGAGGTGFVHDSSLIDSISLEINGVREVSEVSFRVLQAMDVTEHGLSAPLPGVFLIDFARNGRTEPAQLVRDASGNPVQTIPSQLPRITGQRKPTLRFKQTKGAGDCKIRVTTLARV